MLNRGTYVLHFLEKAKENFMVILVRLNYVKIRNFGLEVSFYYRIKLFLIKSLLLKSLLLKRKIL